jgi:hypothetical protein
MYWKRIKDDERETKKERQETRVNFPKDEKAWRMERTSEEMNARKKAPLL